MLKWLRDWLRETAQRGTLILFDDEWGVLSPPLDHQVTQSEVTLLRERVETWFVEGGVLVLPFPVDIDDRRAMPDEPVIFSNK